MEKRTLEITLATAKEWYKGDNEVLKKLALQAFTETELKSVTRVKSWKEFCECYNSFIHEYCIDNTSDILSCSRDYRSYETDRNNLATKEDAEAVLAFIQLKRLRDQWWEALNWKPDYTNYKLKKYCITLNTDQITIDTFFVFNRFLSFPTREIAEDFLKCFGDLIEKAKELI